jgi:hypothetical protein
VLHFKKMLCVWTSLLLAASLLGQGGRSTILGTVLDETGAAVPQVSITVLNTGTEAKRTAVTSERGDFEVPALDIGNYEVSAQAAGFRKAVVRDIHLEVDQRARFDIRLQLGEITQQVEVKAESVSVQTDDSTLSTVIDAAKIRELPLPANRNLFRLALLAPGMSRGPASSVTTSGVGAGFGIASMGQKVHNNAVQLDGAPLKTSMHGVIRMRPSVEAIEEFRVESGWYSAEYGSQSGAQIIAAMRPGANQFHGVLFEFLRNDKLDARNLFNTGKKAPLRRNTFGGVLSGPIIRNKTFFTFNAEFLRERRSTQGFGIYPSASMRSGDLTEPYFRRADGSLIPIMDLRAGAPFPGNQIPASRIAPQAQGFFKFWPSPNFGSPQFNGTNNFTGVSRDLTDDSQEFVRIDHHFSSKDKLFGRYGIETENLPTFPVNPDPYFVTRRPRRQQNATATYTRLVSPSMLNELRVSYNRDVFKTYDDVSGSSFNILKDLQIPGQTNTASDTGLPSLAITGVSGLGNTDINTIWDESRQVLDHFSINKGAHTFKFGAEYTRLRLDRRTVNFVKGAFNFSGIHSGTAPGVTANERGRLAWADFLLDEPSQVRLGYSNALPPGINPGLTYPRTRFWRAHGFLQDDWKVAPNLTLNLGLRYEYNSAIVDTSGQSRNMDWSKQQLFPEPGKSGPLNDPSQRQFAPRIGAAWRPFGGTSTVIRAGYGIFYNVNMINMWVPALATAPPNNININELNPAGQLLIRMATADQAETTASNELNVADTQRGVGSVQQWNLNVQRLLPKGLLFEIGYVGSHSVHFDAPQTVNPYVPGSTTTRIYSQFGPIESINLDASGSYHALLAKLEKRFSRGLTFLQTYSFSKTLFSSFACCGADRHNNPYDWKSEKGLAETNQRQRSTSAWLWELPIYRAKRGLLGQALGGWQINGTLVAEAGLPFYPTQALAPIDDGCPRCTRRPDRIADGRLDADRRSTGRWFDTTAFVSARGHYGNAGRNILVAPGLFALDFAVFKNFRIAEKKQIQFRWENYNFTNTPPLDPPVREISAGNFGAITSAGLGREMQFALRLEF